MKKITGLILAMCVLLTAAGCDKNTDRKDDSTEEASVEVTSPTGEGTTKPDDAVQTAESTTSEDTTEAAPTEKETHILDLDKMSLYKYRWSEDTAMPLVECEYTAVLLGDDADRFPALAAVLADEAEAGESSMKNDYKMLSEAVDEMLGMGFVLQEPLISSFDAQVRRADDVVVSIVTDSTISNGISGGHRNFWGSNYDTETGNTIYLPDVVTDMDTFVQVVEDRLFGTFGADVFYNDGIIKEYFDMYGADGTHWSVDYNGVTVYFDAGEIAADDLGGINVTVTFAENEGLFNEKYTAVPDAYIVALPLKYAFNTDLDGNGGCEELYIYDSYDEENNYQATVDICIGDATFSEDVWAYDFEPYYVKTADDGHYLYLFTELETQMYLYVYDITGGTISKAGELNVSPYYNDGLSAVLTDPDNMHFDIFSDEAGGGVSEGNDVFSAGPDGMPSQG